MLLMATVEGLLLRAVTRRIARVLISVKWFDAKIMNFQKAPWLAVRYFAVTTHGYPMLSSEVQWVVNALEWGSSSAPWSICINFNWSLELHMLILLMYHRHFRTPVFICLHCFKYFLTKPTDIQFVKNIAEIQLVRSVSARADAYKALIGGMELIIKCYYCLDKHEHGLGKCEKINCYSF